MDDRTFACRHPGPPPAFRRRRLGFVFRIGMGAVVLSSGPINPACGQPEPVNVAAAAPRAAAPSPAPAHAIALPEMLAIELPADGMSHIAPSESPLRELLESATAGDLRVTHDQSKPLPLGGTEVTWTAWEGAPGGSPARATRKAFVYVFPLGQTPVGVTGKHNATAPNSSAKVVRDAAGLLHMAWIDGGRPGTGHRVMYRRAAQDATTGSVVFLTSPIRVSDVGSEVPASYVGIEAGERAVHFAWFGGRTTQYRRLIQRARAWAFEPIRNTGAQGTAHDRGPDIAARGDDEIHVLTPAGQYAVSKNGGGSWAVEQVPPAPAGRLKNPALAVDRLGNAHVVFTAMVRNARSWSGSRPNAGHWELRYVRRQAGGGWVDAQHLLAAVPAWGDPKNQWDVLADWPDIAVDRRDTIHVTWHGTANTHIFGNDEAFYARRAATGTGAWGPWDAPQPLHPVNRERRESFSYAPSLAVNADGDLALAVLFFQVTDAPPEVFDSAARLVRRGVVEGPPIPLSRAARRAIDAGRPQDALSTWFPSAAPRLFRHPNGRAWLDVLHTGETPKAHNSPHYVIYQRHDVTDALGGSASR